MTDTTIHINPMAALTEARSLNDYYANRALILANEVTTLHGVLATKDDEREIALQGKSEALQLIVEERDRLQADLDAAHDRINELNSAPAKKVVKNG